jgi:hypothetical protein
MKFGEIYTPFSLGEGAIRVAGGKAIECSIGNYLREFGRPVLAAVAELADQTPEAMLPQPQVA